MSMLTNQYGAQTGLDILKQLAYNLTVGILLIMSTSSIQAAENPSKSSVGFIKGYSWGWTGIRGDYLGDAPDESLKSLAATGANWIALCFAGEMQTKGSPTIMWSENNDRMVTDIEIRRAIALARKHNFKVLLKPVVNCRDGAWRGTITFETEADWDKWWQDYEAFLLYYARIAAEEKCEAFNLGCEMLTTEGFTDKWRHVAAKVREIYQGPIIYNSNHGHTEKIDWWDTVDIIGVSAYYPVATKADSSLEKMQSSWEPVRDKLRGISQKWNKPVLFIEIGVRSADTCSTMPWDWQHRDLPYNGAEQAHYYEAALRMFWDEPWFIGYCWWDWPAKLYKREEAKTNTEFCIYGKPAEDILRKWYAKFH